jgi:hypothetical protein
VKPIRGVVIIGIAEKVISTTKQVGKERRKGGKRGDTSRTKGGLNESIT